MIRRPFGKPEIRISSNLARPPESRFMSSPKNRNPGIKPYQKRFSLVASRIPLPASAKPSNHFLQFIIVIIAHVFEKSVDYSYAGGGALFLKNSK